MSTNTRYLIVAGVLAIIALALGLQGWLRRAPSVSSPEPEAGRIHLFVDGSFVANVVPDQVMALPTASFVDAEKGKTQEGPRVKDVALLYVEPEGIPPEATITVSGVSPSDKAAKSATLTWDQVTDPANHLLFDFAASGDSVKLVSTLPQLDTRDEWVQGVQRIEITTQP